MYDIFIIGGGINGAGIARDAAGRKLKVILIEKDIVGSATSSWSTKLIHGGLRYLENYDFRLVRESLKERDIIFNIARDIVKPLPFIIPHSNNLRPAWMIKLGLFLYDRIGGKTKLPRSSSFNLKQKYPKILKDNYIKAFKYYDLQVDDKELTKLNVKDAIKQGATIKEKTTISAIKRLQNKWVITLNNKEIIESKILINATGPWINEVNKNLLNNNQYRKIRLVKGSHLIFNKLYDEEIAFTFQNKDKRIVFAIPYKNDFTLVGTTEHEVSDPNNLKIENFEINYLIDCINLFFNKKINESMIVDSFSGIRPLIENFRNSTSSLSRDYLYDLNYSNNQACLVNIYGGKITTYRKLSENVVNSLKVFFPKIKNNWTSKYNL